MTRIIIHHGQSFSDPERKRAPQPKAVPEIRLRPSLPRVNQTEPKTIAEIPTEPIEGDQVPNPWTDVDAARANVLRAYGETEALK